MNDVIIAVRKLHMRFGAHLVTQIESLDLYHGETLALVGESGSGKSLTARAIMQLLPSNCAVHMDASIEYLGKNLLAISENEMRTIRGRRIGLIFQEALSALNPVQTIGQQITEVITQHQPHIRDAKTQAINWLKEVHMPNPEACYNRYPHQLSGGMNQRAMIAIALAGKPQVLVADEPTTALDVTVQASIMQLLVSLVKKHHMSMIFITHNLSIVQDFADRVAVMQSGIIRELQTSQAFFHQPKTEYGRMLLSMANLQKPSLSVPNNDVPLLSVQDMMVDHYQSYWFRQRSTFHIKPISFDLYAGKTLAIVGESGSGKTTIAKALLQLYPLSGGSIRLLDQPMVYGKRTTQRQVQDNIQMIFQNPDTSMNPRYTVGAILAEAITTQKPFYTAAQIDKQIEHWLHEVGLDPQMKTRYPHTFSGGQKQRISIARALSVNPRIILCDEPTSALDVSIQSQIIQLLKMLQHKHQYSYVLITHDFSLVSSMADSVIVMQDGACVEQGTVAQVLTTPKHPYTQRLLNAVPRLQTAVIQAHHAHEDVLN